MLIVKLGGSLFNSPALLEWLKALAAPCDSGLVIVPGGGPFADLVRDAQKKWEFDDLRAHRMALRAMEQFGEMLCGLMPGLKLASDLQSIRELVSKNIPVVWSPFQVVQSCPDIKPTWSTSGDSLAAWLAVQLRADQLLLVKSMMLTPGTYRIEQLQALDFIDSDFDEYLAAGIFNCWVAHSSQFTEYPQVMRGASCWSVSISR